MSPFEVSGIMVPDKESRQMVCYNLDKLDNLKDGDILFFEEFPNGNVNVFNACLTLIESRMMVSGAKLPDILIIAAGNYNGMTPMTPQIKERLLWYDIKFVPSMWKDYIFNKYGLPDLISSKLARLIEEEKFSSMCNFYTPRSVDKAINMIIKGVYTPYEEVIKPILETFVKNPLGKKIKLSEERNLEPDETIKWLDLIQYSLPKSQQPEVVKPKKPRKKKVTN